MVDIGSMRKKGDALEVINRWPYMPASYGPEAVEKDHIICRANGVLSFYRGGGLRFTRWTLTVQECRRSGKSAEGS